MHNSGQTVALGGQAQAARRPPPRGPGARRAQKSTIGVGSHLERRYVLTELLGQGGMGRVFRARDMKLGRDVAVKIVPLGLAGSPLGRELSARFEREASKAAQLNHQHAVTVFDKGQIGRREQSGFLVMEYLPGSTLQQALRRGPLPIGDALRVVLKIGSALETAHSQGVVHRDVKPGNIILLADADRLAGPNAKLLDFGLAKVFDGGDIELTRAGQLLGSPAYMAPEQARGRDVDGRCDVYALGAVLFEMLVGRPAVKASHPREVLHSHEGGLVPSPLLLGWQAHGLDASQASRIDAVVQRAMAFGPENRFATMGSMLASLLAAVPPFVAARGPAAAESTQLVSPHGISSRPGLLGLQAQPPQSLAGRTAQGLTSSPLGSQGPLPRALCTSDSGPLARSLLGPVGSLLGQAARPLLAGAFGLLGVTLGAFLVRPTVWQVASEPPGAEVFVGQRQLCPSTPCRIRWPEEDLGRMVSLRLSSPGLDDSIVTRRVGRLGQKLLVTLSPPAVGESALLSETLTDGEKRQ